MHLQAVVRVCFGIEGFRGRPQGARFDPSLKGTVALRACLPKIALEEATVFPMDRLPATHRRVVDIALFSQRVKA